MKKGQVFIGTSGFFYSHWGKGIFYPKGLPQKDWFKYYCQHFKTVELNVSFYRLPKKETFAKWRKRAGPKFTFAIKGSRYITHIKMLKDCQEPVERFFENAKALKSDAKTQKDVILWQLPPRMKANPERLEEFLSHLRGGIRHLGGDWRTSQTGQPRSTGRQTSQSRSTVTWRHAFEFRSSTWLTVKTFELLRKYKAAIVFQDFPDWPITEEVTADFVYLRFHGRTHLYTSGYSKEELKKWSRKIDKWMNRGLDVYVYFNNDALGYAVENAKTLEALALQ